TKALGPACPALTEFRLGSVGLLASVGSAFGLARGAPPVHMEHRREQEDGLARRRDRPAEADPAETSEDSTQRRCRYLERGPYRHDLGGVRKTTLGPAERHIVVFDHVV